MGESIESLRHASLEVVELPTDRLDPNPRNPNRVGERRFEALKKDILGHAFLQPCVVKPKGKRWQITDGEHRWRILKEAGEPTTPCVIDDATDDDADMRLLTLNGLRGRPDPVRLSRILSRLEDKLGADTLRERLGMTEDEYGTAVSLDVGDDDALQKLLDDEADAAPEVLRWRLGPRQARTLERCIEAITAQGKGRAEALIEILL